VRNLVHKTPNYVFQGWIGVSNHHHTSHSQLRAACSYMLTANVSLVYLLGHWPDVNLGAKQG
jgi:hypothetical protein